MTDLFKEYDDLSISTYFSHEKKEFVHKFVYKKGKFPFTVNQVFIHKFVYILLFSVRKYIEIDKSSYS